MPLPQTKIPGVALLLGGLAICGIGLHLFSQPPQYQATLTMQAKADFEDYLPFPFPPPTSELRDPLIICQTMQSPLILSNVVISLKLDEPWDYQSGKNHSKLTVLETIRRLQGRLGVRLIPHTGWIRIYFTDENEAEATNIINAIFTAYHDHADEVFDQYIIAFETARMKDLQTQYDQQTREIGREQNDLNQLRDKLGISDPESLTNYSPVTAARVTDETARLTKLQSDYQRSSDQYAELKKEDNQKLHQILPDLVPDQTLAGLLAELNQIRSISTNTSTGSSPADHPDTVETQARTNELNREIDDRIAGIMTGLENQLKFEQSYINSCQRAVQKSEAELAREKSMPAREKPYYDAKKKLRQLIEQNKLTRLKIDDEKVHLTMRPTWPLRLVYPHPLTVQECSQAPNFFLGLTLLIIGLFPVTGG